jgi:heme a synthase
MRINIEKKPIQTATIIEFPAVKMRRLVSRWAWGLVILTWFVAMLGSYVRLSDAGLGCPDWPGCYGYWSVPQKSDPVFAVHPVWRGALLESGKAWKEMLHRYAVSVLGVGIVLLVLALEWCHHRFKQRWISPFWSVWVIAWLVLQALFGMWTVTLKLMPIIVTGHLLGGMLLWVWMVMIATGLSAHYVKEKRPFKPVWAVRGVWGLVLLQIALGGWVSSHYAAGACGNSFPLCRDVWMPAQMNWKAALQGGYPVSVSATEMHFPVTGLIAIHWLHRIGAVTVLCVVTGLILYAKKTQQAKKWIIALSHALVLQLFLGFANIYWNLPLWSAVAHNGGAALLLGILTVMMVEGRSI